MVMRLVPVLALGTLVLGACSGRGATVANTSSVPAPSASAPPAAAPAASPTPSIPTTGPNVIPGRHVPVMPVQAREHTAGGAAIFAANLIPAVDWAYSTTDSTILKQYYAPDCIGCNKSIAIFDSAKRAGTHFRGGHLTTKTIWSKNQLPADGTAIIQVTVVQSQLEDVNTAGKVVHGPYPSETALVEYHVGWSGDRWKVAKIIAKQIS